jgi:hypothetical protein
MLNGSCVPFLPGNMPAISTVKAPKAAAAQLLQSHNELHAGCMQA